MVMKAEKSHSLQAGDPGKPGYVVPILVHWRARGVNGANLSPRSGEDEIRCPSSSRQTGDESSFPPSFCSVKRPSIG